MGKTEDKECPICSNYWEVPCDQTNAIDFYGRCVVCLFRDNPIEGLDLEEVKERLTHL